MNHDLIIMLSGFYYGHLVRLGYEARKHDTAKHLNRQHTLEHARWMAGQIPMIGDDDKAGRWLGFVQGTLATTNLFSIDELRAHTTSFRTMLDREQGVDAG